MKEIILKKRNRKRWSFLRPSLVCTVQLLLLLFAGRSSGKPASRKWTKDIVGEDLTTYDNYHDMKQALLAGHTLSFSVRPGLCKVATRPASIVGTPIGFTTRHWWIEELTTGEEILHLSNLYLQNDGSSVGASWVQQELMIRSDLDVGEYQSEIFSFVHPPFYYDGANGSKVEHVPKDPLKEHFGECQLGDALTALDLTGSSSEEMVSLADFDSLKRELLSGRQVEGWVDLDACVNPNGTSSKAGVHRQQGFTVESYRVNAPGRAGENIVLVSAWTDEVVPTPISPPPSLAGSPRETRWNHVELQASSSALFGGQQRFDLRIITSSPERFGVSDASKTLTTQCNVPSGGVRLFTRRFDEEQKYSTFEDLRDDLAMGHKFHARTHDGYCTDAWGDIVGDKITGRILRTWETKAPTEAGGIHEPVITFYHADGIATEGSATTTSLQVTDMTVRLSPLDHGAPIVTSHNLATAAGSLETSSQRNIDSDCYLGSSAFMHSPTDDGAVMRKKEDLTAVRDVGAVPSFGAVFTRTSLSAAAAETANNAIRFERRRTSFDTAAFSADKLNDLPGFLWASSRPSLVATGEYGNEIAWLFYTIELDLATGLATLTRTIVDVGNAKATPEEWNKCGFQTSAPQGQGRGVSPCSFILLLNR